MFGPPPRSRGPALAFATVAVLVALVVGLLFGGHPGWLPGPLRSAFTSESAEQRLTDQVIGLLSKDYYRPVDVTALTNDGLQAAVQSLGDPYSHYYPPAQYRSFQNVTDNRLTGIGVQVIGVAHRGLRIEEVYGGTPAARGGLMAGDVITAIGRTSVADWTFQSSSQLDRASALIEGRAGTPVTLTIDRGGHQATRTLTRADVTIPVAAGRILTDHGVKLGYVQLTMFSDGAGAEVRTQVARLLRQGARALILDLRDNGGGLLQEAVDTASVFIQDGTIVSTDGRAQPRQVYLAKGNAIAPSMPMVVLVNRNTASAAEIVTGALKDRGRATVVGTHTYGKGVFQEIEPLHNGGALDFTVGEYFTPNGENLGAGGVKRGPGIAPEVYASTRPDAKTDTALTVAERTVVAKLR